MRWQALQLDQDLGPDQDQDPGRAAAPALFGRDAVARTFDTPGFRGMTFYEVHAKSIINRVPAASRMPFEWTINPYRGCGHACVYCFARKTHTYLELDAGEDFDSKVVVKVNAAELARRELAAARWAGGHVAMGTNVDCYQRAEGRYQLMPGIIGALRDARNPFSILTKGTLILRDLDLLAEAAELTDVGLNVSVGFVDKELSRLVEPGTPSPRRRLGICSALAARGLRCGVLMGPVLPFLSDSPAQLAEAVEAAAAAGAASVTPIVLHLRPGTREWFEHWLARHHPELDRRLPGAVRPRGVRPARLPGAGRRAGPGAGPALPRRRPLPPRGPPDRPARAARPGPGGRRRSAVAAVAGRPPGRQPGLPPGREPAVQVGGPADAEVLQRRGGQAGGVALRAEDDDPQVIPGLREPRGAGRVEPPLQHVALHDQRAGDLALGGPLGLRPDVDEHRPGRGLPPGLLRAQPGQPRPGGREDLVDGAARGAAAGAAQRTCGHGIRPGRSSLDYLSYK